MTDSADTIDQPDGESDALQRFLKLYFEDEEAAVVRTPDEYAALFPGHEQAVLKGLEIARQGPAQGGDHLPERIGPYRILDLLGRGGQGAVYLAEDVRIGRRVALKVLEGRYGFLDGQRVARFEREAKVAASLQHPGICPVFEAQLEGAVQYLVMPYLDGEPLNLWIRRQRGLTEEDPDTIATDGPSQETLVLDRGAEVPAIDEMLLIIENTARALHVAHEAGIVHRDVKPGNILLATTGDPVILDFGLARGASSDEAPTLTETGQFLGTLPYMSPEQIRGDVRALDRRTDIYSLGVTLYECLALRLPFQGPTQESTLHAILEAQLPDPRRYHPDISADLEVVIATALDPEPARRYQTAEAFAEDLRRVRENRPIVARPAGMLLRVRRWAQRHPFTAAVLSTLFLFLAVGLTVTLWLLATTQRALEDRELALAQLEREQVARQISLDELQLRDLPREADELWPALPATVTRPRGMNAWLSDARRLQDRLPHYQTLLGDVESRGVRRTEPADARRRAEKERLRTGLEVGKATLELLREKGQADTEVAERIAEQMVDLRKRLEEHTALEFAGSDDALRHRALSYLCLEIPRLDALIKQVARRRQDALDLERLTLVKAREAWALSIQAVSADQRFAGFTLSPQLGLIPLGQDPGSGLLEFSCPLTGDIPARNTQGELVLGESTAVVFVLVPGGQAWMGAIRPEESGGADSAHQDPDALPDEIPVHQVRLNPYLISKYELTQGQWLRMTGEQPSGNQAGMNIAGHTLTLRNPVEQVSWTRTREVLARFLMSLPTEAQWERAARAGATTPWWAGDKLADLEDVGNIADAYAKRQPRALAWQFTETVDDGHLVHAPVGTYRANRFGLHDVIGNVSEWCLDRYATYQARTRSGDGYRLMAGRFRVARGGGYSSPAKMQRLAMRARFSDDYINYRLGMRPVWPLESGQ